MEKYARWLPMKKRSRFFLYGVMVFCILLAFSQSLLPAEISAVQSSRILEGIQRILPWKITLRMVRKGAHLLEFAILGGLTVGFRRTDTAWWRHLLVGTVTGMVCGVCDETLQLFVRGRSANLADVWLDTLGAFLGTNAVLAAGKLRRYVLMHKSTANTGR